MDLKDLDLYSVAICGKRGTDYRESREREFYAHSPKKCKQVLEWLVKNRRASDRLKVGIQESRDCEDEDYSRRYETESYGSYNRYLTLRLIDKRGNTRTLTDSLWLQ